MWERYCQVEFYVLDVCSPNRRDRACGLVCLHAFFNLKSNERVNRRRALVPLHWWETTSILVEVNGGVMRDDSSFAVFDSGLFPTRSLDDRSLMVVFH